MEIEWKQSFDQKHIYRQTQFLKPNQKLQLCNHQPKNMPSCFSLAKRMRFIWGPSIQNLDQFFPRRNYFSHSWFWVPLIQKILACVLQYLVRELNRVLNVRHRATIYWDQQQCSLKHCRKFVLLIVKQIKHCIMIEMSVRIGFFCYRKLRKSFKIVTLGRH